MAGDLALSPSQVHASLKRLERSRLIDAEGGRPLLKAVEEFLVHGVKYAFPAQRGQTTRGLPTSYAAPPLSGQIVDNSDLPPVWPDPDGEVRGATLEPLHKAAPKAARKDPMLHELLALIDALRDGRVRERQLADVRGTRSAGRVSVDPRIDSKLGVLPESEAAPSRAS